MQERPGHGVLLYLSIGNVTDTIKIGNKGQLVNDKPEESKNNGE